MNRKIFYVISEFIFAFIGILNFINVMASEIISRKKEFAMLESIGMTYK
jgi:putative ABC transport system permease protein